MDSFELKGVLKSLLIVPQEPDLLYQECHCTFQILASNREGVHIPIHTHIYMYVYLNILHINMLFMMGYFLCL